MSLQITRKHLEDAFAFANRVRSQAGGMRSHGEYVAGTIATQAESGLAAFGYGVAEGRFGPIKVGPVSADLLAGVAMHLAGFSGLVGKHAGHAHNFAIGLLDGYVHRLGIGLGTAMAMKAGRSAPSVADPKGAFHFGGTRHQESYARGRYSVGASRGMSPLTEAEIASMAQQVR